MSSQAFPHFAFMQRLTHDVLDAPMQNLVFSPENAIYDACTFEIGSCRVMFRAARVTPTKKGLFVVFWKRADDWSTIPYDWQDPFDVLVVSVVTERYCGQFVFPKNELVKRGYVASGGVDGKRALRVYPPGETLESAQAQKTQTWQAPFFFEVQPNQDLDSNHIRELYKL